MIDILSGIAMTMLLGLILVSLRFGFYREDDHDVR